MAQKYGKIYEYMKANGCEPGNIVWQRNRWRVDVWKGSTHTQIAMSGTREDYPKFQARLMYFAKNGKVEENTICK